MGLWYSYYLGQSEAPAAAAPGGSDHSPAFDAFTQGSNHQWVASDTVSHTPVGTPKGAVVVIVGGAYDVDEVTGVTYGGTAMTRTVRAQDSAVELGVAYIYFLGSSVPTGAQDVVASYSQAGNQCEKVIGVYTLTGTGDLSVLDYGAVNDDATNPSSSLNAGAVTGIAIAGLYSGQDEVSYVTEGTGVTEDGTHDWGAYTGYFGHQATPATGVFSIGWTAASDDVALVAVMVG